MVFPESHGCSLVRAWEQEQKKTDQTPIFKDTLKSELAQAVHEIEDTKDDHDEARANLVVNDEDSLT